MIENVLVKKNCSVRFRITVKSLVSLALIALAVVLPQLVHLTVGEGGGVLLLPMYLPVLLGGCLLGAWWGLGVGIASPLVSFLITLAFGSPMPALARLPFMTAELAVFALVSGLFSKKIPQNKWLAFSAVLLAAVSGRAAFMLLVLIFQSVTPFTPALIWSQIQTGLVGLVLQAVLVPLMIIALSRLIERDEK